MLILSIPYRNKDSRLYSRPSSCELTEYRLDYADDINDIDFSLFDKSTILTLRDYHEGGKQPIADKSKLKLIKNALEQSSAMIDCEMSFLIRNPQFFVPPDRLILSLHTDGDMGVINEYLSNNIDALFYKIAVRTNDLSQLEQIAELAPYEWKNKLILVPLPPATLTTRLLFKLYNSAATYVCLSERLVENQISLSYANHIRINGISSTAEIYLIIGGPQVINSLSVIAFNRLFMRFEVNKVLLPVQAQSASEALSNINWIKERAHLKGIAITMPFKKEIPYLVSGRNMIANSWNVDSDEFANTDESAFMRSLDYLKIYTSDSVLIFGTGATSVTAQKVLKSYGYDNVTVLNRNSINQRLAQINKKTKDLLLFKTYDLLINCTPFGLAETDNVKSLPDYHTLIDLPYGTKPTKLVIKAIVNSLPNVDGFSFWKWQAAEQLRFFNLDIDLNRLFH